MNETLRARAEARLKEALPTSGWADPREPYRERLRALRKLDSDAFDKASRYYEEELLPRVAEGQVDALAEWFRFGKRLAELSGAGRVLAINQAGTAGPARPTPAPNELVLHLPESAELQPFALAVPQQLSPAQQASYDLLVLGRTQPRTS